MMIKMRIPNVTVGKIVLLLKELFLSHDRYLRSMYLINYTDTSVNTNVRKQSEIVAFVIIIVIRNIAFGFTGDFILLSFTFNPFKLRLSFNP